MISETRVYSQLYKCLKSSVKADAVALPEMKAKVRQSQRERKPDASSAQSNLYSARQMARARQLVYGFVRGMDLERMERPTKNWRPCRRYFLERAWKEAVAQTDDATVAAATTAQRCPHKDPYCSMHGEEPAVPMPDLVKKHVYGK